MHFYFSCPRSWCWFTIRLRISCDIIRIDSMISCGEDSTGHKDGHWWYWWWWWFNTDYRCYYILLFSLLSWVFLNKHTRITIGFFLTINDKLFSLLIVIIGITLFSFLLSTIPYYYYQYYHDNQLWYTIINIGQSDDNHNYQVIIGILPYYYYQYYHWHLQYDDFSQRTPEEGRRLSLMQPTTLRGCHGFCCGKAMDFAALFAAEWVGIGTFFFGD